MDLQQFILKHIDSVDHLRALLLLRNEPTRSWGVMEVGARLYRVDVQEHLSPAEAPVHVIGETTGLAGRVVSSVADEDPWWHQVIN